MEAILMAIEPTEDQWISREGLQTLIQNVKPIVNKLRLKSEERRAMVAAKLVLDTLGYPYMICSSPKIK